MIRRQHDLLCLQTELIGDAFDCVDRGAVNSGLTSLAQASIVDSESKPFEQALQSGRSTIESRALHHLRSEESRTGSHNSLRKVVASGGRTPAMRAPPLLQATGLTADKQTK